MRGQSGFTLIEIMVVVTILALLLAIGFVGFGQLEDRQRAQQAESLLHWLQSLEDRATLEGAAYGARLVEGRLQPMAYRQGIWLPLVDMQSWESMEGDLLLLELDSDAPRAPESESQPDIVILPDGSLVPPARLVLRGAEGAGQSLTWSAGGELELGGS